MIVIDTNIIGYLYINSNLSHQAEKVYLKDPDWAAPLLWRSELRNVLALYIRKNLLTLPDAQGIMRSAMSLMQEHEFEVPSDQVLKLAAMSGCSAYDCEFVALAQDLDLPLVTVDREILKKFPETAVLLDVFSAE